MKVGQPIPFDTTCPYCGKKNELQSAIDHDHAPSAGGVTLCVTCGEWAMIEEGDGGKLFLRKPTADEHIQLGFDETTRQIRAAWDESFAEAKRKEEAEKTGKKPPPGVLEGEWSELRAVFGQLEDQELANRMRNLFYLGAMACFRVFDEARDARDTKPIHRLKRELNQYARDYLYEHGVETEGDDK